MTHRAIDREIEDYMKRLAIKAPGIYTLAGQLSGGNDYSQDHESLPNVGPWPEPQMLAHHADQLEMIRVRGRVLPLFRLAELFDVAGAAQEATQALVVVLESAGRQVGLLVDEVIAKQQVVIKSMGSGLGAVQCLSGAAILPDGQAGLIINPDEIVTLMNEVRADSQARPQEAETPATESSLAVGIRRFN